MRYYNISIYKNSIINLAVRRSATVAKFTRKFTREYVSVHSYRQTQLVSNLVYTAVAVEIRPVLNLKYVGRGTVRVVRIHVLNLVPYPYRVHFRTGYTVHGTIQ